MVFSKAVTQVVVLKENCSFAQFGDQFSFIVFKRVGKLVSYLPLEHSMLTKKTTRPKSFL